MQGGSQKGEQGNLNQVDTGEMAGMPKDVKPPSASPAEHHSEKRQGLLQLPMCTKSRCFVFMCLELCGTVPVCSVTLLTYVAPVCVHMPVLATGQEDLHCVKQTATHHVIAWALHDQCCELAVHALFDQ